MIQGCIKLLCAVLDQCEERWNDGRKHLGGDQMTYADFNLMAMIVSQYENEGAFH